MKSLQNQTRRLQEQREWMQAYEELKAWEEIVIDSDDKEELMKQITVSSASEPRPRRRGALVEQDAQDSVFES